MDHGVLPFRNGRCEPTPSPSTLPNSSPTSFHFTFPPKVKGVTGQGPNAAKLFSRFCKPQPPIHATDITLQNIRVKNMTIRNAI